MKNENHSYLFVPAIKKMLNKINLIKADAIIVDLEDAIKDDKKNIALQCLCNELETNTYNKEIYVRINPKRAKTEVEMLKKYEVSGYMLPKVEKSNDIDEFSEIAYGKRIIALIESPMGILNAEEIIRNKHTYAVAFGAEDYTTISGIHNTAEYLMYPKSKIVTISKAYKKIAIDTISLNIHDKDLYSNEVLASKNYGFNAKLAIHPMQVDIINNIFQEDIERYREIIKIYDESEKGVLKIEGQVYEKPHIEMMRKKIEGN